MAQPDAVPGDREKSTGYQRGLGLGERRANPGPGRDVEFILHPQERHAGAAVARGKEELGKIQVLREHHVTLRARPTHQLGIRGLTRTKLAPVPGLPTAGGQQGPQSGLRFISTNNF